MTVILLCDAATMSTARPSPSPSAGRPLRSMSGSLPSPPNMGRPVRRMTIDEMRLLHKQALSDAEAKRTELRLVLASRYRELVGSSDEVLRMGERAKELHELVHALPSLMEKLAQSTSMPSEQVKSEQDEDGEAARIISLRRDLSRLPRVINRALDKRNVHQAATSLIELFSLIASQTDEYPLANALSNVKLEDKTSPLDPILAKQIKMTYLHVETLPVKTKRLAKLVLQSAAHGTNDADTMGARQTAAALSTLKVLDVKHTDQNATDLLDLYFNSKAKLMQSLLNQLATTLSSDDPNQSSDKDIDAEKAEDILSRIVLILQYDIIMYPYLVFVKRNFPAESPLDVQSIMESMPMFNQQDITAKVSRFLADHLPLIETKAKSILVTIAGTTASALGKIRQSLYDKTDGVDSIEALDSNGVATWEEAVTSMVDLRIVHSHGSQNLPDAASKIVGQGQRKFSLWSALFSNTFSSLVHSLLTTSFHSVHARVVSSLRTSLANAPPFSAMLPHEAYRNTLRIATELDAALLKVSEDAHELLVHAEEREESERRLRQSLYVQTCEIMGRLVCELRRMLFCRMKSETHATKEYIVGRLCHLLKFRLTSLPTLLNPSSSPAALISGGSISGMITLYELQSAFELADDNDDGLITFEEAMESVDSAFSGTQFHGAEMVRETLLLGSKHAEAPSVPISGNLGAPSNVTLGELTLLSARGLRHESSGRNSALGTIQSSLDDIIASCFSEWASVALEPFSASYRGELNAFLDSACSTDAVEWHRTHSPSEANVNQQQVYEEMSNDDNKGIDALVEPMVANVSPYVIGYIENLSSVFSRSVCPSDSLKPVPSAEDAASLGIVVDDQARIPSLMDTIRWAILRRGLLSVADLTDNEVTNAAVERQEDNSQKYSLKQSCPSALIQLDVDIGFFLLCFFERNIYGFGQDSDVAVVIETAKSSLSNQEAVVEGLLQGSYSADISELRTSIEEKHRHVFEVCDLFISALFGEDAASQSLPGDVALDLPLGGSNTVPLFHPPLQSSQRFALLPIQTDRSISELQRRGKIGKEKGVSSDREEAGSGVIGSGLGFFSSMLKKK